MRPKSTLMMASDAFGEVYFSNTLGFICLFLQKCSRIFFIDSVTLIHKFCMYVVTHMILLFLSACFKRLS